MRVTEPVCDHRGLVLTAGFCTVCAGHTWSPGLLSMRLDAGSWGCSGGPGQGRGQWRDADCLWGPTAVQDTTGRAMGQR